jgi:hypothetical protein
MNTLTMFKIFFKFLFIVIERLKKNGLFVKLSIISDVSHLKQYFFIYELKHKRYLKMNNNAFINHWVSEYIIYNH